MEFKEMLKYAKAYDKISYLFHLYLPVGTD